jgi:hypothetical protein
MVWVTVKVLVRVAVMVTVMVTELVLAKDLRLYRWRMRLREKQQERICFRDGA